MRLFLDIADKLQLRVLRLDEREVARLTYGESYRAEGQRKGTPEHGR